VAHAGPNLKPRATYKIARRLPEIGAELQYRVKGDHEHFERVVRQYEIVSLEPRSSSEETAIPKTSP